MFSELFDSDVKLSPKEGELYRELTVFGRKFRLLWGYYEDFERDGKYNDPMPIYPDLIREPVYTDEGIPIVTAMQDVCVHYEGKRGGDSCNECAHFKGDEELFGLCTCYANSLKSGDGKR